MIAVLVLAALYVAFVVFRLSGVDGNKPTAALLALTPYAVPVGVVLGVAALVFWMPWTGGVVLAATALLVSQVLRRMVRSARPDAPGHRLRLLSANLFVGRGDVKTVLELVREHEVDVLHLVELTPAAVEEFTRAGLFDLLPYRVLHPAPGGAGSGVISRHPLTELALPSPATLRQVSAEVDLGLGEGGRVQVVAVHPVPPTTSAADWKQELAGLPAVDPTGPIRILAGDFNATPDHATFRRILAQGYADAGERCGAGLKPTWPARMFPPPVTLDHVLADTRAAVRDYRVFVVPGSDHHAVYAELALPELALPE